MHICLLAAFSIFLPIFAAENEGSVVAIEGVGNVKGTVLKTIKGKNFFAFRGIPYTEPPVGQLRFKPPVPKTPWTNSLDATKDGADCIQFSPLRRLIIGEEDCLFLNVYTDSIDSNSPKKAVMVFIHGGAFYFGSGGSHTHGPRKILDHDVVLVTLNYRLHSLGFLDTEDDSSPGNYGLLDQREALLWVQKNIHAFGGDPDRVTLFGESSGGMSVFHHILSPLSTGLFHRAIAMSGNSINHWGSISNPLSMAKKLGEAVGCEGLTSSALVECLREKPAQALTQAMAKYLLEFFSPFPPTVDDHFLPDEPSSLLKRGQIANRVPLLMGVTKDEGLFYYGVFFTNKIVAMDSKVLATILSQSLNVSPFSPVMPKLIVAFMKHYSVHEMENADQEDIRRKLVEIMSNSFFISSHYQSTLQLLDAGLEPYIYSYDYDSGHNFAAMFGANISGVGHAEDLHLAFDGERLFPQFVNRDDTDSNKFLQLWVNFAKFGNPTPEESDDVPLWQPVKNGDIFRYRLGVPITTDEYSPEDDFHRSFWMETIPAILAESDNKKDEL